MAPPAFLAPSSTSVQIVKTKDDPEASSLLLPKHVLVLDAVNELTTTEIFAPEPRDSDEEDYIDYVDYDDDDRQVSLPCVTTAP